MRALPLAALLVLIQVGCSERPGGAAGTLGGAGESADGGATDGGGGVSGLLDADGDGWTT